MVYRENSPYLYLAIHTLCESLLYIYKSRC